MNKISFRKLNDRKVDYLKLYKWCQNKFVYEWFEQRILSFDEICNKYEKKLMQNKQKLFIIKYNDKDIGFVQIYRFDNDIEIDVDGNVYEYDLFIGEEEYLDKGIGKEIVNKVNDIIYSKHNANFIILRPFERNIRAIKCYEKCGFKTILKYLGKDTLGNDEVISVLYAEKED